MEYNFGSGKIITSGLALFCLANFSPAWGQIVPDNTLPVNSQVTPGCTNCTIDGGTVRGNSLFHSFEGFSIPTGGQAYFNNADQIANIFSRVTGLSVSTIDGLIRANGAANLFLINPQGIVFGPNARIDVGGAFVASSASGLLFGNGVEFSATNPDAPPVLTVNLTPGLQYGGTNQGATVQNEGVLAVKPGQDLTLAGETVLNSGTLIAPGGTIQVLGDYVGLLDNATLDVSSATVGGTVLIGGGFEEVRSQKSEVRSHQLLNAQETFIGPNVIINADGVGSSDGGQVAVWSEKNTDFQGTITARGGELGGDGGFIETSAKENLTITGTVNASAINGNAGTWLIDPTNITITNSGGEDIGDSVVNVGNLNTALNNGTNVEITTNIKGTEEGNITQESEATINWSSPNSLTFNADNNITLNSSIEATGAGAINLSAGRSIAMNSDSSITTTSGAITLNANPGGITSGNFTGITLTKASISSTTGNISLTGSGGNGSGSNNYGILLEDGAKIRSTGTGSNAATITFNGKGGNGMFTEIGVFLNNLNTEITSVDGNILVIGDGGNGSESFNYGIALEKGAKITSTGMGSNAATITLNGTGGNGVNNNLGVLLQNANTEITSVDGDISVTGFGGNSSGSFNYGILLQDGAKINSSFNGYAGNILINTDQLSVSNGAQLNASTFRKGNGGSIIIKANDLVKFDGGNSEALSEVGSQMISDAVGNAGDISITTGSLEVTDGALLGASNFGKGSAGSITIEATDLVKFDGGNAFSNVNNEGDSGGISITTGSLEVLNGAQLNANTGGIGNGGSITIEANDLVKFEGEGGNGTFSVALSEVGPEAVGKGGDISITTGSLEVTNAVLTTSTSGVGDAGRVEITATDWVKFDGEADSTPTGAFSNVNERAVGNAGNVSINTGFLEVTNNARLSTRTSKVGDAGRVEITATDWVKFDGGNSGAFSNVEKNAEGQAGDINIQTRSLSLINNSQITAQTSGKGNAGNIKVRDVDSVSITDSIISSQSDSDFKAGDVTINANGNPATSVTMQGIRTLSDGMTSPGGLSVEANGVGDAGSVIVNARQLTVKEGAEISATNISSKSENITLRGLNTLEVRDGGQITASTETGIAGNLSINQDETPVSSVQISGANSRLAAEATGEGGNAGDVTINAQQLTVADGATVSARNVSAQEEGGSVNLRGLNTLNVFNGGQITASTETGEAGDVRINQEGGAADSVEISGADSRLAAEATGEGGKAGGVTINARQLTVKEGAEVSARNVSGTSDDIILKGLNTLEVLDGGKITASTETGRAGNLTINKDETPVSSVQISGIGSNLAAQAENPRGEAGSVTVNARDLTVGQSASISASNVNAPEGGNITLENLETLQVSGGEISATTEDGKAGNLQVKQGQTPVNNIQLNQGKLTVQATGTGDSGSLTVNARALNLQNNAEISASTNSGEGGDISLQGLDTLQVNNSNISASTQTGEAGNVRVNQEGDGADSVQISGANSRLAAEATKEGGNAGGVTINAEQLTVADGAKVSAQNVSAQEGGSINLQGLNTLNVLNGGQITASTETGTAGNLTINKDQTPVNSVQISGKDSILGVGATGEGDNVRAGDLTVNAGEMTISDGAAVTVSSPEGQAGTLTITTAQNLRLNEGSITAETGQSGAESGGANIILNVADLLFLANQSEISANARADANGGNVDINARFVIASFPAIPNGSDISANAEDGDGGRIDLTADGIFGIEFREEQTPLSDITATSESGEDGIVTLDDPNDDPSRSVTELAQPVDPSNQIVRACVPTEEGDSGEFTVTGRGGLPASPSDVLSRNTVLEDLGTLATSPQTSDQTEISKPPAPPSAPLVEADGWILAKNGDIIFISKAASESPQPPWQPSLNCPTADHPH